MRGYISQKVLDILKTNIKGIELTQQQAEEDLSLIGMDSISLIHVIVEIENMFEIEIPDEKLLLSEMNTLSKIVDVVCIILSERNE